MKSASSTASRSGQQKEKSLISDDESLVKAQRCSEHRHQTPGEELL